MSGLWNWLAMNRLIPPDMLEYLRTTVRGFFISISDEALPR